MGRRKSTPGYRLHKASGRGIATIDGKDHYFGPFDDLESRKDYDRLIAKWLASGRRLAAQPGDTSIVELIVAFLEHAETYYRRPDGTPSGETSNLMLALAPVVELMAELPVSDFGPMALKAVRSEMIRRDLSRGVINSRVSRIIRCFRWGVENEIVPPSVHQALTTVAGLREGRSEARETEGVKPARMEHVKAVLRHANRQVSAMIWLQLHTGMRPGEVCVMTTGALDRSECVWVYDLDQHKTRHLGKGKTILIGPRAQLILKGWLRGDPDEPLFQPCEARAEWCAKLRAKRKTKVQPSQVSRKKDNPERKPGNRYRVGSYYNSIRRICQKHEIPSWHPHQLRHSAATRLRREFGLEVARLILGHSTMDVTEIYAEIDNEKIWNAVAKLG